MEILLESKQCCNLSTNNLMAFVENGKLNKKALKPYLTFQYSVLDETFFKNTYIKAPVSSYPIFPTAVKSAHPK